MKKCFPLYFFRWNMRICFSDGLLEKSAVNFQHFLSIPFLHQNNALNNPIRCVLLLIGCDVRWWRKGCGWEVCVQVIQRLVDHFLSKAPHRQKATPPFPCRHRHIRVRPVKNLGNQCDFRAAFPVALNTRMRVAGHCYCDWASRHWVNFAAGQWGVCANSLAKRKSRFAIVLMGARCCRDRQDVKQRG